MSETTDELNGKNPLSSWVRPVIAFLAFFAFAGLAYIVVTHILNTGGDMQWVAAVLVIFAGCFLWYFNVRSNEKMLEKFANLAGKINPKASSQTVTPATTGTTQAGDLSALNQERFYGMPKVEEVRKDPIPFDEVAFDAEANDEAQITKDFTVVNTATRLYEARDKVYYRWKDKGLLNNTEALLDFWHYILDLAQVNMATTWWKAKGGTPETVPQEMIDDPVKYVNEHFADFRNCPSCKAPVGNEQVDIKWLSGNLGGDDVRTSYLDVLDAFYNIDTQERIYDTKGNQV